MKRLFYFLIVLTCTLLSCGKSDSDVDDPNNPDNPENPTNVTLDISTTDLTFEASGGQKEFTIYCNSDWTITNNSSWCKTDVTNGNGDKTITVTANPYGETEDQNTNVTIKAGNKTKVLTITQKYGNALTATKNKFDVSQEGGNIIVEIKSNIEYQISIPYQYQTWIKQATKSKALGTKDFNFTILANEDFDKRDGYIMVQGNSLTEKIYIYQAQKNQLILTEDSYNIPATGKDITVELRTNVDYEVTIPSNATSWISQITTKAIRTDQLKFHITKNEGNSRDAKIVIKDKNSDLSDTLFIVQGSNSDYAGDIVLRTTEDLVNFKEAGYKKVYGNLTLKSNDFSSFSPLNNILEEITGNLIIESPYLTNFDGLYNLKRIGGNLIIRNDIRIVNFEGLNSLEEIGGSLSLYNRGKNSAFNTLKTFKGLEKLKYIGNDLQLYTSNEYEQEGGRGFTSLESFEGLNNLERIGGNFEIYSNSRTNGEKNYGKDDNSLRYLLSYKGLDNLKYIGGDLSRRCSGEYYWWYNSNPANNGWNNCTFSENVRNFSTVGLEKLEEVGGNIYDGAYMGNLENYKGLINLKYIGGELSIDEETENDFSKLETVGSLNISLYSSNNYHTKYPNALSNLRSAVNLHITWLNGNDWNILKNNITIDKELYISYGDISDLTIIISKINSVGEKITISDCDNLYDFCSMKTLLSNFNGIFSVSDCGYNPTKYQILNGECSKQAE